MSRARRFLAAVVLAILGAAFVAAPAAAERLRFVFTADSRSEQPTVHPVLPIDLINTAVLGAIRDEIRALSPPPSFVVFGGDMAYRGNYPDAQGHDQYTFETFRNFFAQPLADQGIPTYTVVGNHELYKHPDSGFFHANQIAFQQAFPDNPANGMPGHERLDYSFHSPGGDAFFAVLDGYYLEQDTPGAADPENDNGTITDAQLAWLREKVAASAATHKFLITHAPYYSVYHPPPDSFQDASYTRLWQLIDDAGFDAYLSGHIHLFSRKTVDASLPPDPQIAPPAQWRSSIVQLVTGTAGAGVDAGPVKVDASWHVANKSGEYYFSVVDIDGPWVTVTSYVGNTGAYRAFDRFAFCRGADEVPALSLPVLAACIAAVLVLAGIALRRNDGDISPP